MSNNTDQAERLDTLEVRIAHQDQIIDELSQVSAKQWSEISGLNEQIDLLKNKLQELENGLTSPPDQDVPPPHF
ncbi:MAG: SlyX protein [Alphaproteobacteria bacterium]|nr:SlyX protein [Alphaproteobacteria bacterium]